MHNNQHDDKEAVFGVEIPLNPVQSTNMAKAGYSEAHKILHVEFQNGSAYRYTDVPPHIYDQLLSSRSKGSFIAKDVKGKFKCLKAPEKKTEE